MLYQIFKNRTQSRIGYFKFACNLFHRNTLQTAIKLGVRSLVNGSCVYRKLSALRE